MTTSEQERKHAGKGPSMLIRALIFSAVFFVLAIRAFQPWNVISESDLRNEQITNARIVKVGSGSDGYYHFVFNDRDAAYLPQALLAEEVVMSLKTVPMSVVIDMSLEYRRYGLGQIVEIKVNDADVLSIEEVRRLRLRGRLRKAAPFILFFLAWTFIGIRESFKNLAARKKDSGEVSGTRSQIEESGVISASFEKSARRRKTGKRKKNKNEKMGFDV